MKNACSAVTATLLIAALWASALHAQSASSAFDASNSVTLRGSVVGIGPYIGADGLQHLLVFDVAGADGITQRWATAVAERVPFTLSEPVVVQGFRARANAPAQSLLPFGAMPMLSPIAAARRLLRATDIRRQDGTVFVSPRS